MRKSVLTPVLPMFAIPSSTIQTNEKTIRSGQVLEFNAAWHNTDDQRRRPAMIAIRLFLVKIRRMRVRRNFPAWQIQARDKPRRRCRVFEKATATDAATSSIVCAAGSTKLSSVRLCVRPSVPSLRRVCCCGPGSQAISIDCCTAGAQQQIRAVSRCQPT